VTEKELLRKTVKNLLLRSHRDRPESISAIHFEHPTSVFRDGQLATPDTCATLFTYLPFGTEADPRQAIQTALGRDIPVAVPRVAGEQMRFHRIFSPSGPFEQNRWGIPEPPECTPCYFSPDSADSTLEPEFPLLVLVPALAFDRKGMRLGRGGGYYDRFLASLLVRYADRRDAITLAGVGFSLQIIDQVPGETHDISVDCLYTDV